MAEEEKVETTVEETVAETKTDDIEKMKAALEKANKEAAKYRHKVEEAEKKAESELIAKSESLEELRGILKDKESALESTEQQAKKYAEMVEKFVETELEAIPEDKRDLVPNLSPEEKLDWIRNAKSKNLFGTQKQSGPTPRLPGDNDQNIMTRAEFDNLPWEKQQAALKDKVKIVDSLSH